MRGLSFVASTILQKKIDFTDDACADHKMKINLLLHFQCFFSEEVFNCYTWNCNL